MRKGIINVDIVGSQDIAKHQILVVGVVDGVGELADGQTGVVDEVGVALTQARQLVLECANVLFLALAVRPLGLAVELLATGLSRLGVRLGSAALGSRVRRCLRSWDFFLESQATQPWHAAHDGRAARAGGTGWQGVIMIIMKTKGTSTGRFLTVGR